VHREVSPTPFGFLPPEILCFQQRFSYAKGAMAVKESGKFGAGVIQNEVFGGFAKPWHPSPRRRKFVALPDPHTPPGNVFREASGRVSRKKLFSARKHLEDATFFIPGCYEFSLRGFLPGTQRRGAENLSAALGGKTVASVLPRGRMAAGVAADAPSPVAPVT